MLSGVFDPEAPPEEAGILAPYGIQGVDTAWLRQELGLEA
jgi:hypothetical protein